MIGLKIILHKYYFINTSFIFNTPSLLFFAIILFSYYSFSFFRYYYECFIHLANILSLFSLSYYYFFIFIIFCL
jgi:hypothetical protein